ncbi:MAG: MutS family DNA mismatch repair protein, partial [Nitrospiraceae bacterium]
MSAPLREPQLERLLRRIAALIRKGQRASSAFSRWRLILFIAALLCAITFYKIAWFQIGNWSLATFVTVFAVVAGYHNRLESRIHRLRQWQRIKRSHLARIRLDWEQIPERAHPIPSQHPYATDLDLIGTHSLLQLLDTTVSSHGRDRLAGWLLLQPPDAKVWTARQTLIRELAPRSRFRDRLVLTAHLLDEQEINGQRLAAVLQHQHHIPRLRLLLSVQTILALTTATLGLAALLNWLPGYWMFSFGLYALIYLLTDQGEELLEHAVGLHHEVDKFGTVLRYLEQHARRPGTALAATCRVLTETAAAPSSLIRRVARVLHGISVKAHPLVHLFCNAIGPWDLSFALRLQHLQRRVQAHLPMWLDRLAEVEAASALATFAYLHPSYAWPSPRQAAHDQDGSAGSYAATALGHPLIPATTLMTNDFSIEGLGTILLVTGSNMSGKSTFLRTVGINLCLAQAGGPVCAGRFDWTWSRLACCIRIDDSLDAGLSFFYAEVKRLKTILDATQERTAPPVLFLIDEIFKGTNNRERLIGSRVYIKRLATGNGLGLVSTHDLELTDLEKEIPSLTNAHFQETVSAGALEFDYRLRPGPCPTTNALRIMELEG